MARIRTVKPDFFTSADVVSLTPLARLLYIATWLEADREGRFVWRPQTLKLRYLPGDMCDIAALADELVQAGLVVPYVVDDQMYAEIPTFTKHQVINNRESASQIPARVDDATSTRDSRVSYACPTPLMGKEGKGREGSKPTSDDVGSDQASPVITKSIAQLPECPHQEIIALYREHLPDLPQPRTWEGQRANNLKARWRWAMTTKNSQGFLYATDRASGLDFFRRYFHYVGLSNFLTGRDGKWRGCNLAWLVKAENFLKVLEGQYEDREAA